jgi:hypothetical protein
VDQKNAVFVGRKTGNVEIRITFSEATAIVEAFVQQPKIGTTTSAGSH